MSKPDTSRASAPGGYEQAITDIANAATAVGFQAGEPAMELAGQIVSVLAANPELIERFRREGTELFIDGSFDPAKGSLSYRATSGATMTPAELRSKRGQHDQ
jgi:hypothetical protein